MSPYELGAFSAIYAVAVATPGPGIAAIVARCLAGCGRSVPAFIAGFVVGDGAWLVLAALGLGALARTAHLAFEALKYLGAAYLLYLAWRLWQAPAHRIEIAAPPRAKFALEDFLPGLTLALGNPKVMVFFVAVLPTVVRLESLTLPSLAELLAVMVVVQPLVLGAWAVAAARAQRVFRSAAAVQRLNRGSATILAAAAIAVACR
jgi:threonine/homoserine/homoserine lactone efflux protein